MKKYLRLFGNIIRHEGFRKFLKLILRKLYRRSAFFIYEISLDSLADAGNPGELVIEKGSPEALAELRKTNDYFAIELYWDQFNDVKDCYLGYLDDRLVHISWVFFHNDNNKYFPLKTEEAMVGPCLTYPAARGKGVYPNIIKYICHELKLSDINKVYMVVEKDNIPSIKGIERAGLIRCGEIDGSVILTVKRKSVEFYQQQYD